MSIQWQGNRSYVTANHSGYTLTCLMIREGMWSWVIYRGKERVDGIFGKTTPTTRAAAQRAAEKAMQEHINKQQSEK